MLLFKATCFQSEVSGAAGICREEPGMEAALHRAKQHRPPVLPFGNLLIALHGVKPAAAARLQAQKQHMAGPGSASAGTRYKIATFDVIPAGRSSDV